MKKLLLLIPALLLVNTSAINYTYAENDITLDSSITSALTSQLKKGIELSADITFNYESYLKSLKIVDQVNNNSRTNIIYVDDKIIQESYLESTIAGGTVEKYLTISNTTETRDITDSDGNSVSFSENYGSPFIAFSTLNNAKINSYFEVTSSDNGYILTANDLGYGCLSNALLDFYYDYDGFYWDESYSRSIDNLILTINQTGTLTNISFDKIIKDIYGAIKEHYDIDVTSLDTIQTLSPITTTLTTAQKEDFNTKMSNFQTLINTGNFTQSIEFILASEYTYISYNNYYAFNEDSTYQGMICSCPLEDSSHGETYIGVFQTSEETYSSVGISPKDDYSGTISDLETLDIADIAPQINDISVDLFTYNEETKLYSFDLDQFIYDDTHFCSELLIALFGAVDPAVHNAGLFTYDGSSYSFDTLSIGFNESGYLYGSLDYSYYGYPLTCNFEFSNVGTTDLLTQEDISEVVDYLLN